MGVSASHIDWTMVPYVRLSFAKHYNDSLKYLYNDDKYIDTKKATDISIEDNTVYSISSKAYEYALKMTERELMQAVEGMYHNLNTLQSRSGN